MGKLLTMLTRFVGATSKAVKFGGNFHQTLSAVWRVSKMTTAGLGLLAATMAGPFIDAIGKVISVFKDAIKNALGFDLSISGLLEQAEKARRYYSELADELNFFSDREGSVTKAMNILTKATGKSAIGIKGLQTIMQSMVDAGADSYEFVDKMVAQLGNLEAKTGVAGTQFGQMAVKFEQMFKGRTNIAQEVLNIQKSLVGTGLLASNLEQAMQGLSEVTEKLAFATRGETLSFESLNKSAGRVIATFKAFGINVQTTNTFLSGLLDPENIDKNMLLMNKLGYSYEEFNQMLNTGRGHEAFFDRVLSNIGSVASEANMIEDAATRYKYLKDTLGLPPEFANKLLKVEPYRIREEIKKLKKEMQDAEKHEKHMKKLKEREEKYQEQMDFIRFEMVAPLVDFVKKNRQTMKEFMITMKPVIKGLSELLKKFLMPFDDWFSGFMKDMRELNKFLANPLANEKDKAEAIRKFVKKSFETLADTIIESFISVWNSDQMQGIIIPMAQSLGRILRIAIDYAITNATPGRKVTWKQAASEIDERDEKSKTEEIYRMFNIQEKNFTPSVDPENTGYTSQDIDKQERDFDEKTKKEIIEKVKKLLPGLDEKNLSDLSNALFTKNNKAILNIINEIKKNSTNEPNASFLKKLETAARGDLDLRIDPPKKFHQGDKETTDIKNNQSPVGGKTIKYSSAEDKKVVEDTIEAANSPANIQKLVKVFQNNPQLMAVLAGQINVETKKEVSNLKSLLTQKDTKLTTLENNIGELKNKIAEMEKNPVLKEIQKITNALIGDTDPHGAFPIKSMLYNIEDALTEDAQGASKNNKDMKINFKGFNQPGPGVAAPDQNLSVMPDTGSQSGTIISSNDYLSKLEKANIKNIAVRQTLYLKAIAESTFSTAKYTRTLAYNLIYTTKGLAVYLPQLSANQSGGNAGLVYSARNFSNFTFDSATISLKSGATSPFAVFGGGGGGTKILSEPQ